jgi:hypothetical protein
MITTIAIMFSILVLSILILVGIVWWTATAISVKNENIELNLETVDTSKLKRFTNLADVFSKEAKREFERSELRKEYEESMDKARVLGRDRGIVFSTYVSKASELARKHLSEDKKVKKSRKTK